MGAEAGHADRIRRISTVAKVMMYTGHWSTRRPSERFERRTPSASDLDLLTPRETCTTGIPGEGLSASLSRISSHCDLDCSDYMFIVFDATVLVMFDLLALERGVVVGREVASSAELAASS